MGAHVDILRYFAFVALCGLVASVDPPVTSGAVPAGYAPRQFFGQPGVYDPRFRAYPSAYSTYSGGYGSRYGSYPQTYQPRYSPPSRFNNFAQFGRPYTYTTASAPFASAPAPFTTATAPVITTGTIVGTPATTATTVTSSGHTPLTADTCPEKIDPTAGMDGLSPQEQAEELKKQQISAEQLCHLADDACKCARVSACGWSAACGCVAKDLATPGAVCLACPDADGCAAPAVPASPQSCPAKIDPTVGMKGLSAEQQAEELKKRNIKPEQLCHLADDACKCARVDVCGWSPVCGCVESKLATPNGACQACPTAEGCAGGAAVVQQPSAVSLQEQREQQEKEAQEARVAQLKILTDVLGNKGGRSGRSRGSNDKEARLLKLITQVREDEANGGVLGDMGSSILPLALMGADDDSSDDGNLFGGNKGFLLTMLGRG